MVSEVLSLEFYEVGNDEEMIMYIFDAGFVPRIGERLYLARTEKVLGIDPDKEHRDWKVVDVEWFYAEKECLRQVAITCERVECQTKEKK